MTFHVFSETSRERCYIPGNSHCRLGNNRWVNVQVRNIEEQEWIPVGCVTTAVVAVTKCLSGGGVSVRWVSVWRRVSARGGGGPWLEEVPTHPPPPVDTQTLLKTLPSLAVGKYYRQEECTPVGCVPSATIAVCWGGVVSRHALRQTPPLWTDRLV